MKIEITSIDNKSKNAVFLVSKNNQFTPELERLNEASEGLIAKAVEEAEFDGQSKKFVTIVYSGEEFGRIIIAGTGKEESDNPEKDIRELGASIQTYVNHSKIKEVSIVVEAPVYGYAEGVVAANLAYGAKLKSYRFDKYFTKQKDEDKPSLTSLSISTSAKTEAETKFDILDAIAEGVFLARDVVSEPPNVIYPESYANRIKDEMKKVGVKVDILDEKDLTKLGMHALLGVGQGSRKDSRVVVMTHMGSEDKKSQPIAFIGKGVTFDTGGISLKPSNGMEDMKYDMGGSAAVVGVMKALGGRDAKVNAVGVVGLVENMPDGNAQRPSDVVTSMSGQTIEVLNTDAEGRLVLADILWYAQDKYKPKFMIDLATLTGAVVVALGSHKAGLMANNDDLADKIYKTGEEVGERFWRLPLGKEYDKQIDSKIADMQNISNTKGGGTVTAGQFLQRFVNDTTWAHLDIAGMAWADKAKPLTPVGAVGFGVQALDRLVANYYED